LKIIFTTLLIFISSNSLACFVPPFTLLSSDRELVARSPNIALAKVIKQKKSNYFYDFTFVKVESIRGEVPKKFTLKGYSTKSEENLGDFSKHQDPIFWAFASGNSVLPGDCRAYGIFEVSKTYLIFFNETSHVRSFEEIQSKDDIWLNVVKLLVKQDDR